MQTEIPNNLAETDIAPRAKFNPWLFVPLLYFMQAIPVTVVSELSTVFYKDFGIANEPITRWTALISLPWSLQFLLGPLVDLRGTKRRWILGGQLLITVGLIGAAAVLDMPHFFELSLLILGATAVTSALCNIATDGFYIIAMSKEQQAKYVGVQTTAYRLGRLFCTGLLVLAVGLLMRYAPVDVHTSGGQSFVLVNSGRRTLSQGLDLTVKDGLLQDTAAGVVQPEMKAPAGVFGLRVDGDGSVFAKTIFGESKMGDLLVLGPSDSAEPTAKPHSLAVGVGQSGMSPALAWPLVLLACTGLYFFGYLVNRITTPHPAEDAPAEPEAPGANRRNLQRTLLLVAIGLAAYFFMNAVVRLVADFLGHKLSMPGWILPAQDKVISFQVMLAPVAVELIQAGICVATLAIAIPAARRLLTGTVMADAFTSFVRQPGFLAIFGFILSYRFGEAMVSAMAPLFLKDSVANGGLAIPNDQFGLINGFAGVIGIVLGGLLGGYVVSRLGLRRSFWPLAILMHLPNLLYLWAAIYHPAVAALYGVAFVDQFGYGFGFAAYMVYIMWVAQRGRYKTAHYAVGTGMGALCIAVARVTSGIIQSNFGYVTFFTSVIVLSLPGMLMLLLIPLDEADGRGRPAPAAAE